MKVRVRAEMPDDQLQRRWTRRLWVWLRRGDWMEWAAEPMRAVLVGFVIIAIFAAVVWFTWLRCVDPRPYFY